MKVSATYESTEHQRQHPAVPVQRRTLGEASLSLHQSPRQVRQRQRLSAIFGDFAPGNDADEQTAQREVPPVQRMEDKECVNSPQLRASPVQLIEEEHLEDDTPIQPKLAASTVTVQRETVEQAAPHENKTGMPGQLKANLEAMSGFDLSEVRVHRNSDKPAQLNALAYAQGNEIHLGPGQEQHLPHEAWHVVQQKQRRVQATSQIAGIDINDNKDLEREADRMADIASDPDARVVPRRESGGINAATPVVQAKGVKSELLTADVEFEDFISATKSVETLRKKIGNKMYKSYKPFYESYDVSQKDKIDAKADSRNQGRIGDAEEFRDRTQALRSWNATAINSAMRIYLELDAVAGIANKRNIDLSKIQMGRDTKTEPDSTLTDGQKIYAIEAKHVSSPSIRAADDRLKDGIQQLGKRDNFDKGHGNLVPYTNWSLVVRIDNSGNPWPVTISKVPGMRRKLKGSNSKTKKYTSSGEDDIASLALDRLKSAKNKTDVKRKIEASVEFGMWRLDDAGFGVNKFEGNL